MDLFSRVCRIQDGYRQRHQLAYWTIAATLVVGCAAPDTAVFAQGCATVANQNNDTSEMPLAMPEDLLDLGNGGGVYCNDSPDGSQIQLLYSPVSSEEHQTFWIVANPELVTEQQVDQFFDDQTKHDLTVELIDTSEDADYYLASTDLQAGLTAVQTSTRTLSIADYSALRVTR